MKWGRVRVLLPLWFHLEEALFSARLEVMAKAGQDHVRIPVDGVRRILSLRWLPLSPRYSSGIENCGLPGPRVARGARARLLKTAGLGGAAELVSGLMAEAPVLGTAVGGHPPPQLGFSGCSTSSKYVPSSFRRCCQCTWARRVCLCLLG